MIVSYGFSWTILRSNSAQCPVAARVDVSGAVAVSAMVFSLSICEFDLRLGASIHRAAVPDRADYDTAHCVPSLPAGISWTTDRQSVLQGKSVTYSVDLGGRRHS